jgi:hypothetical protein
VTTFYIILKGQNILLFESITGLFFFLGAVKLGLYHSEIKTSRVVIRMTTTLLVLKKPSLTIPGFKSS